MKIIGSVRAASTKRTIRLLHTVSGGSGSGTSYSLKTLMDSVNEEIAGSSSGKHAFFFRLKAIEVEAATANAQYEVNLFGRPYLIRTKSTGVDAVFKTDPVEFWGLWHDGEVLDQLADKGTTTGLDNIMVSALQPNESIQILMTFSVEFIPKTDFN